MLYCILEYNASPQKYTKKLFALEGKQSFLQLIKTSEFFKSSSWTKKTRRQWKSSKTIEAYRSEGILVGKEAAFAY